MSLRAAIFLDRDGVINRNVLDPATGHYGAPLNAQAFEFAAGALDALLTLQRAGFLLFLISNQPNYAKGKSSREELAAIHSRLQAELDLAGIRFVEFYYCYHHPDGIVPGFSGRCDCRKPSPYFIFQARKAYGVDLESSWMIGDRATDSECGRAAGLRTIRVVEDHSAKRVPGEVEAEFEALDLADAAKIILHASPPVSKASSDLSGVAPSGLFNWHPSR